MTRSLMPVVVTADLESTPSTGAQRCVEDWLVTIDAAKPAHTAAPQASLCWVELLGER